MKNIFLAVCFAAVSLSLCADGRAQQWRTDFGQASAEAKSSGKHLLLDFSGSDWCGWCKKLDREVFSTPAFKRFARDNLVCMLVDFPRRKRMSEGRKKENMKLARKYKVRGFPTVILLSPEGKIVGKTGYRPGGGGKYVSHLRGMMRGTKKGHANKR